MDEIQVRIRIDEDEDLTAAEELAAQAPDVTFETISAEGTGPTAQVEPVTAILVGAGVAFVAKFVVDWWDRRRGGLVIDGRETAKDEIYRDPDVPFGYVVVFPRDGGEVKIETKDAPKDAVQQLLESLIQAAFKSVTDVANAAKSVVPAEQVDTTQAA